jgi:hypothetical protein
MCGECGLGGVWNVIEQTSSNGLKLCFFIQRTVLSSTSLLANVIDTQKVKPLNKARLAGVTLDQV